MQLPCEYSPFIEKSGFLLSTKKTLFLCVSSLNGKVRKKNEGKCVLESTCLVTSLHFVHVKMVKTCPKKVYKEKIIVVPSTRAKLPSLNEKKFHTLHFL